LQERLHVGDLHHVIGLEDGLPAAPDVAVDLAPDLRAAAFEERAQRGRVPFYRTRQQNSVVIRHGHTS
jgi:hypothetical protein